MSRFIIPGLIIGSKVSIAKFGASIGSGDQAKTVSADWLPVPPSDEDPGPWLYMGKVRTSNPQIEPKTAEIEGTSVGGTYETEEMQLVTKRKFLFASNYITPEFLQLSFGLREDWSRLCLPPAPRRSTSTSTRSGPTPTATAPGS